MRRLAASAAALLALPCAAALAGGDGLRQAASFTLSQTLPASPTAEHFVFDYVNPGDPAAKPPPVRRVETILPSGARYDPSVPASCTASDAELVLLGAAACPHESSIGGGVVTVDTGLPGPARVVTADVEFFNNAEDPDGEFIYLNTVRGTGLRTVIRADVTRRRTVTEAPLLPGTPPDGGAIDTVDVRVADVTRVVDGERRSYITTPPDCPDSGAWITKVRFGYADGVSQTVRTANPCELGGRDGAR